MLGRKIAYDYILFIAVFYFHDQMKGGSITISD